MPDGNPLATGWDLAEPGAALSSFLAALPAPPRLLALGEPTHGVYAFPAWRNRIFQTLVTEHGFRSIAIESDVIAGMRVNAHVATGEGTLDEVLHQGFSHEFGRFTANRELVAWMRRFNAERDEADRARFYGFDPPTETMWAPSPRASLTALRAFLVDHGVDPRVDTPIIERLCGEDAPWTDEAAAMDPARSIGRAAAARDLRVLADDLDALLETQAPGLDGPDGLWEARLHARTALGLLRYHAIMADGSEDRIARLMAQRSAMMAANLEAIAEREAWRGPTLVFAHNSHLQRDLAQMRFGQELARWWPVGAHVCAHPDPGYAVIVTGAGQGAGLPLPAADTLEGWLRRQSEGPRLYATQRLLGTLPASLKRRSDAPANRFFPLEPDRIARTDGLLFLPEVTPDA